MKFFQKNLKRNLLIVVFALILFGSLGFYNSAKSKSIDNMLGFAYEGDDLGVGDGAPHGGMEWLSFNCANAGSDCGQSNYGVNIDTNGYLTGYAWSPSYGWAKFGGLDGFPSGAGTSAQNAQLLANGNVVGWFRFCSAAGNPSTCSGASSTNWVNGGWDGWVSLHGNTYGVTYDANVGTNPSHVFAGYAWGGNTDGSNDVGWIDFSRVSYSSLLAPLVSITADPNPIPDGGSAKISWQGINLDPKIPCDATIVSPSPTPPANVWNGTTQISPSGTFDTGVLTSGTYTYKIKCYGQDITPPPQGNPPAKDNPSNLASIDLKVGVVVNFTATPSSVPYAGPHTTNLKWKAVPSNITLTNCVAKSAFSTPADPLNQTQLPEWKATTLVAPPGTPPNTTPGELDNVPVPYNPTAYQITCNTDAAVPTHTSTEIIYVPWLSPPKPSVELKNTKVDCSTTPCTTTLSWQALNLSVPPGSCKATVSDPSTNWDTVSSAPAVAPYKNDTGTQSNIKVFGKQASGTKTKYTLTCNTLNGTISTSLFLNDVSGVGSKKYYQEK